MIDTYRLTLNQRNYSWSQSLLEGEFYFDRGPFVVWKGEKFPDMTGRGIRLRLLGRLRNQYPEQIDAIYGGRLISAQPNKVPLIKHGSGVTRIGIHFTKLVP